MNDSNRGPLYMRRLVSLDGYKGYRGLLRAGEDLVLLVARKKNPAIVIKNELDFEACRAFDGTDIIGYYAAVRDTTHERKIISE